MDGDTVNVVENHMDVIKQADYVIDLSPEGGRNGGEVLCCGTLNGPVNDAHSNSEQFLKMQLPA